MTVDLDAARRARAEARGEQPDFTIGGKTFALVAEIPIAAGEAYSDAYKPEAGKETVETFLRLVLADSADAPKVLAAGLTWGDLPVLLTAWHLDSGESSASNGSSVNGGKPSRPTSKRTTTSTSRKRSGSKG